MNEAVVVPYPQRAAPCLAEISLASMINVNERVGHLHDEHCAILLERRFDGNISLTNRTESSG